MLTKIITVDQQNIGTVKFHAYIVVMPNDEIGFAIYLNDFSGPLILFVQEEANRVNFRVDDDQFYWIVKNSKFKKADRQQFYDEFEVFMRNMEYRAKVYLFQDNTINYISASREIIRYKNEYIDGQLKASCANE
ncbi:MAG: hypothetical protein ACTJHT_11635 [Sphingobacterium sp.]|uniref:hypothetical protein n=1 Tax=Sphingobacterium sp. JB170 TaxID=1434842 RepID=UPI00097E7E2F|nr:hypothetical protein [Sphingobacterium sp. JB170]SJN49499.1 hypothetical protein FM107_18820 [Sphingobacterium sp. JB170]